MPTMVDADGSEDVNDFLLRIRELGVKRDKEDEERTKKLEEEILQGRKERQARRAEHARSISPTKESTSNVGTPSSLRSMANTPTRSHFTPISAAVPLANPSPSVGSAGVNNSANALSGLDRLPIRSSAVPAPSTSTPSPVSSKTISRTGTLSWQQRPTSRGSTSTRSRPSSTVIMESNALKLPASAPDNLSAVTDEGPSRDEIVRSLGAKDPSWFKQTADRGLGSAAYLRNQAESLSETSATVASMRLPGLSKEFTMEADRNVIADSETTRSISTREESVQGNSSWSQKFSSTASSTSPSTFGSPMPTLSSHHLEAPSDTSSPNSADTSAFRAAAMSPSQGRILPERLSRPSSPTKGLGGFVQSAMLKRSDSVNKRWSAQASPGLARGNTFASNRSGYDGLKSASTTSVLSLPKDSTPIDRSRVSSPVSHSRPGSSYTDATIVQHEQNSERTTSNGSDVISKSALPERIGYETGNRARRNASPPHSSDTSLPTSPMRSADAKRWSPTKASWLENAINKSEPTKSRVVKPQPPAWMADVNKAKQLRGSTQLEKSTSFKDIPTDSPLQSSAAGTMIKSPSLGDITGGSSTLEASFAPQPRYNDPGDSKPIRNNAHSSVGTLPSNDGKISSGIATNARNIPAQSPSASLENTKLPAIERSPRPSALAHSKPLTPPKKDFRSTLKTRQVSGGSDEGTEPEFKNVFGKLRRAETKNYVAPDELKSNILRGKAGLTATGGPKKSERRDELKESILKKKEEMRAGLPPALARNSSGGSANDSRTLPTPEAIAKRRALTNDENISGNIVGQSNGDSTPTHAVPLHTSVSTKPKPKPLEKKESASKSLQGNQGKLGNRFNPTLASILLRGPSPVTASPSETTTGNALQSIENQSAINRNDKLLDGSQLTHMTKARARGPKRRLPTATATDNHHDLPAEEPQQTAESPISSVDPSRAAPSTIKSLLLVVDNITERPLEPKSHVGLTTEPTTTDKTKTKSGLIEQPIKASTASYEISNTSTKRSPPVSPHNRKVRKPSTSVILPLADAREVRVIDRVDLNHLPTTAAENKREDGSPVSVVGAAARRCFPAQHSEQPQRSKSPIKLPTRHDEEAAAKYSGFYERKAQDPVGLGIQTVPDNGYGLKVGGRDLPSPPMRSPRSPPIPSRKPDVIVSRLVSTGTVALPSKSPQQSVTSKSSNAVRIFTDFFGELPISKSKFNIDAHAALTSRPSDNGKIKTLRKQIWEVTGDGKKFPVPSQQEHILFEESMYLCSHVFGSVNGKRTSEVYLWCGDGVPPSAIDDAQIFSRSVARDVGGKLIILRQGKESPNFFEALGGIVITRQGSSTRLESSSSGATYMLCGRRHMGQIAFDEVTFSPSSLCSGFPYIVSATSGRLFLWKGKGSGADELGCARLIGMDLGLTGEIEEVDEGKEPATFWKAFPRGGTPQAPAVNHWHLKPSCERYDTRLFAVELDSRSKSSSVFQWGRRGSTPAPDEPPTVHIKELTPFAQSDLTRERIFMLDAFFEIFIIIGSLCSSKFSTCRAALLFAQEYGILAASLEDRPFVPVGHVVLRGTPPTMKFMFRNWDDRQAITMASAAGNAEAEAVVLPLIEALEATGE